MDFATPKNMKNEETMHTLAEMWSNATWREYIVNSRNQKIVGLRAIKTGTLEGDALELSRQNGEIQSIEELIRVMKIAYEDANKLQQSIKDSPKIESINS